MERNKIIGYSVKIAGAVVGAAASAVGGMFIAEKLGVKKEKDYANINNNNATAEELEELNRLEAEVDGEPVKVVESEATSEQA